MLKVGVDSGRRARVNSKLRPVPEFKEDMNAGTFPKWVSHDD